jgi:hypothetical protein
MGLPPIIANGLPGSRVEPYRAGITATTLIGSSMEKSLS